jgi:hypothetical protein
MKRWMRFRSRGKKETMPPDRPVADSETLRDFGGKWVAIRDGQVIAAFETFDAVYEYLHSKREVGATILRVPAENEPELVGFG